MSAENTVKAVHSYCIIGNGLILGTRLGVYKQP